LYIDTTGEPRSEVGRPVELRVVNLMKIVEPALCVVVGI
jgi:hypothetical protein